jgi:hypothetical protein
MVNNQNLLMEDQIKWIGSNYVTKATKQLLRVTIEWLDMDYFIIKITSRRKIVREADAYYALKNTDCDKKVHKEN